MSGKRQKYDTLRKLHFECDGQTPLANKSFEQRALDREL